MKILSSICPEFIKYWLLRKVISRRYDVVFKNNVKVSLNSKFEGKSIVNKNCDISGSCIGLGTFISSNSRLISARIGRFCSIGQNVQTRFGLHPSKVFVSTHPAFFSVQKQAGFTFVSRQLFAEHNYIDSEKRFYVEIGNDVWIGNNVQIMDGVRIGDGAIIGLGSIVTKEVEPYSINIGIPATKIGYRFSRDQIEFLLKFKWWERDFEWILNNSHLFSDINAFIKQNEGKL